MNNQLTFKSGRLNGRSLFLFVAAAAMFILFSCRKSKPDLPSQPPRPMVKTVLVDNDSSHIISYYYDRDWRVIRIGTKGFNFEEFTYTKDSVVESQHQEGQSPKPFQSYHFGANGYIDISRYLVDPFWSTRYEYNSDDQLISCKPQDSIQGYHVIEIKCTYKNGNLDTYETISVDARQNTLHAIETYDYYPDKENMLSQASFGRGWAGKGSKDLLRSRTAHDNLGNSTTFSWTYEFDARGRISAAIMHFNTTSTRTQYTYY